MDFDENEMVLGGAQIHLLLQPLLLEYSLRLYWYMTLRHILGHTIRFLLGVVCTALRATTSPGYMDDRHISA